MTGGARHHVLLCDLVDDPEAIAAYDRWHQHGNVPPAVLASIRNAGIREMAIHRVDNRLVMVIETDEGFDAAARASADAASPDVLAWERLMDIYQRPLGSTAGDPKWSSALPIFRLSDQP